MSDENNSEMKYLQDKLEEVSYNDKRFTFMCGNNKYIFGIVSPQGEETSLAKIMQYKTIFDTLKDMDYKIKLSFQKAIDNAYSNVVQKNFSVFQSGTEEETLSYYYIENALFRTISLWEMLAQLYRLYYKVKIEKKEVEYKKFFNSSISNYSFKIKAREINSYLYQKDDINLMGEWRGNHKFVNGCRNKMIHQNSPTVAAMSDYDINLKNHPVFFIKRIIEDYVVVSRFINDILDKIDEECIKEFS